MLIAIATRRMLYGALVSIRPCSGLRARAPGEWLWWRFVMCVVSIIYSAFCVIPTIWWMFDAAHSLGVETVLVNGIETERSVCFEWGDTSPAFKHAFCARVWLDGSSNMAEALLWAWTGLSLILAAAQLVQTIVMPDGANRDVYNVLALLRVVSKLPSGPVGRQTDGVEYDTNGFTSRRQQFNAEWVRVVVLARRTIGTLFVLLCIVSAFEAGGTSAVFQWNGRGVSGVCMVVFFDALVYDASMTIDDFGSENKMLHLRRKFARQRRLLYPTMPIVWLGKAPVHIDALIDAAGLAKANEADAEERAQTAATAKARARAAAEFYGAFAYLAESFAAEAEEEARPRIAMPELDLIDSDDDESDSDDEKDEKGQRRRLAARAPTTSPNMARVSGSFRPAEFVSPVPPSTVSAAGGASQAWSPNLARVQTSLSSEPAALPAATPARRPTMPPREDDGDKRPAVETSPTSPYKSRPPTRDEVEAAKDAATAMRATAGRAASKVGEANAKADAARASANAAAKLAKELANRPPDADVKSDPSPDDTVQCCCMTTSTKPVNAFVTDVGIGQFKPSVLLRNQDLFHSVITDYAERPLELNEEGMRTLEESNLRDVDWQVLESQVQGLREARQQAKDHATAPPPSVSMVTALNALYGLVPLAAAFLPAVRARGPKVLNTIYNARDVVEKMSDAAAFPKIALGAAADILAKANAKALKDVLRVVSDTKSSAHPAPAAANSVSSASAVTGASAGAAAAAAHAEPASPPPASISSEMKPSTPAPDVAFAVGVASAAAGAGSAPTAGAAAKSPV